MKKLNMLLGLTLTTVMSATAWADSTTKPKLDKCERDTSLTETERALCKESLKNQAGNVFTGEQETPPVREAGVRMRDRARD